MSSDAAVQILPYSLIVGQAQLKLALELAYIAPRIGGVLPLLLGIAARASLRRCVRLRR